MNDVVPVEEVGHSTAGVVERILGCEIDREVEFAVRPAAVRLHRGRAGRTCANTTIGVVDVIVGVDVIAPVDGKFCPRGTVGVMPTEGRSDTIGRIEHDLAAVRRRRRRCVVRAFDWRRKDEVAGIRHPVEAGPDFARVGVDGEVIDVLVVLGSHLEIPYQLRLACPDRQPHQARFDILAGDIAA